jgi:hypothetical protein
MKPITALKLVNAHPSKRYSFVFLTEEEAKRKKDSWYQWLYSNHFFIGYTIKRRGNVLTIEKWSDIEDYVLAHYSRRNSQNFMAISSPDGRDLSLHIHR